MITVLIINGIIKHLNISTSHHVSFIDNPTSAAGPSHCATIELQCDHRISKPYIYLRQAGNIILKNIILCLSDKLVMFAWFNVCKDTMSS